MTNIQLEKERILEPIHPMLLLGIIILIYPTYISIKNYLVLGSKEYLLLASLLVALVINTITGIELNVSYPGTFLIRFICGTTYELVLIFFTLHALRLKSEKTPWYNLLRIYFVINYLVFLSINLLWKLDPMPGGLWDDLHLLLYNLNPLLDLFFIGGFISELMRLVNGILIIYVYRSIKPVAKMENFSVVTNLWKIIGILLVLGGGGSIAIFILQYSGTWGADIFNYWGNFLWTVEVIMDFVLLIIAIRYPEALLITEAHILRASKLYIFFGVSQHEPPQTTRLSKNLLNYIKNIPQHLITE